VPEQYTTQLQRLGAPSWIRWIAVIGLGSILFLNLGVITFVWSHDAGGAQKRLLAVLWLVALAAGVLLIRLCIALRRGSHAHGAGLEAK
jgi:hypothetical protein